ncbi:MULTISPECIES: ABC transporter substrate-binding protein [unclassified Bradyrhizobium]|uniref:ABC transporter substrate-binding protein n=1 Tax=unclassified Bradyrhizobium TaxID=2631580 RepID=UPI0024792170|nr:MULTISPECIES: ABC transporter substrate-binding protein [unclassified Bradyrhizobium]WGS19199.1 ABC transporter substrate-binding protein [Bradyrhizobium sp. ISRA463]WGS26035.1 ABC transporter substrate-binding protein [Bradyrhizobium sp. ISRA464]
MGKKKAKFVLSLLGVIVAIAAGWSSARAADEILIGLAGSTSGAMASFDDNPTKMAQIFVDDINAKGGLLGKKLKVVFADAKSDRVEGVKAAQEVLRQGADIVFGSCDYDYGSPAVFEAQKAGKIGAYLCAEDPKAGIAGPNVFTTSAVAQAQGVAMANWGYEKKGFRSAYVLLDDYVEYGKSVCGGFEWKFASNGGSVVGRDTFKNTDVSIASQVTRIREAAAAKKVDVIMLCSNPPGGASAMRQIRAAGIDLPVMSDSAMDGTYWLNSVPGLKEFYLPVAVSIFGDDPRKEVAALIERYKAKFNSTPATNYAFPIYSFLELWAKAVAKVGSLDTAKVVQVMNTFKHEPTTLGPRTFASGQHIQTSVPLLIISISNGEGKVIDQVYDKEPIPSKVLYRTGN